MNPDQIGGLIRTALAVFVPQLLVPFLVLHGVDQATATWIGSGLSLAAIGVWSWITNRPIKTLTPLGATIAATPIADARKAADASTP